MTQVNGRIQASDGFGDQQDLWPNDMYRWEDTDSDGFDDNSDVCPDEAGSSTIDQLGCLDRDGDGVSDQYDSEPDDPEVALTSEFVRTTLAEDMISTQGDRMAAKGMAHRNPVSIRVVTSWLWRITNTSLYSMKTVIQRYDRTTGTWDTLKIGGQATNDCTGNPSHPEIVVADDGQVHVLERVGPTLKYHVGWSDPHLPSIQRIHLSGFAMAVDGDHVHITRTMQISGDRGLKYEYSNNGGSSWSSTLVRMAISWDLPWRHRGRKGTSPIRWRTRRRNVSSGTTVVEGMGKPAAITAPKTYWWAATMLGLLQDPLRTSGISAEERSRIQHRGTCSRIRDRL